MSNENQRNRLYCKLVFSQTTNCKTTNKITKRYHRQIMLGERDMYNITCTKRNKLKSTELSKNCYIKKNNTLKNETTLLRWFVLTKSKNKASYWVKIIILKNGFLDLFNDSMDFIIQEYRYWSVVFECTFKMDPIKTE